VCKTCRTAETLAETIKFDHGYTRDSGPAGHFVRVLEALDAADQRRFLRFVTGSPRLPPGGIAALQVPCLTASRGADLGLRYSLRVIGRRMPP